MTARGRLVRLALASAAFLTWAPFGLAGLPLAGLLVLTPHPSRRERLAALVAGMPSVALLALPDHDVLSAMFRAYIVLVTAAFLVLTLVAPAPLLRQAARASGIALITTLALGRLVLGEGLFDILRWAVGRAAVAPLGLVMQSFPDLYPAALTVTRVLSEIVPATLLLQTFAGLALAWQWYHHLARAPYGAPLAPFREFRFADAWVWGIVAGLLVCTTPLLTRFHGAALNLLVVLGSLYLLRGAAVAVACAAAVGLSATALGVGLAVSAVLALPLLLIVPGLTTLGLSDTWLEFRRRLPGRSTPS